MHPRHHRQQLADAPGLGQRDVAQMVVGLEVLGLFPEPAAELQHRALVERRHGQQVLAPALDQPADVVRARAVRRCVQVQPGHVPGLAARVHAQEHRVGRAESLRVLRTCPLITPSAACSSPHAFWRAARSRPKNSRTLSPDRTGPCGPASAWRRPARMLSDWLRGFLAGRSFVNAGVSRAAQPPACPRRRSGQLPWASTGGHSTERRHRP